MVAVTKHQLLTRSLMRSDETNWSGWVVLTAALKSWRRKLADRVK